jgi:hypothetical protein
MLKENCILANDIYEVLNVLGKGDFNFLYFKTWKRKELFGSNTSETCIASCTS